MHTYVHIPIHTGTQGHTHTCTHIHAHTPHTRAHTCTSLSMQKGESVRKADYTLENSTFAGDLPSHTIAVAKKKLRHDIYSSVTGWCVDILQDRQEQTTQETTCKQGNVRSWLSPFNRSISDRCGSGMGLGRTRSVGSRSINMRFRPKGSGYSYRMVGTDPRGSNRWLCLRFTELWITKLLTAVVEDRPVQSAVQQSGLQVHNCGEHDEQGKTNND